MGDLCNAVPRWFLILTLALLLGRIGVIFVSAQNKDQKNIPWRSYNSVKDSEVLGHNKPVLIFVTHGSHCVACKRVEKDLQASVVADEIDRRFIPVKVLDTRVGTSDAPENDENKKFLDSLGRSAPIVLRVAPQGWNVNGGLIEAESQISFIIYPESFVKAAEISSGLENIKGAYIKWKPLAGAFSASSKTKKPLFIFFTRTRDQHCINNNGDLLSDEYVSKTANEKCIPIIITDYSRSGKANSPEAQELINRYAVKSFPTVCIIAEGHPPLINRSPDANTVTDLLRSVLENSESN